MKSRWVPKALFLIAVLLCTMPIWAAEKLYSVKKVSALVKDDKLRLILQTDHPDPQISTYFLAGPDRLVVEIANSKAPLKLGRKPATKMVASWALKRAGLNRTKLVLGLRYRPPTSDISLKVEGKTVRVEVSTEPGRVEKWKLTKGVTWVREDRFLAGRWTRTNQLLFDPADPEVEVLIGLAKEKLDTREKLSSMVRRYGALAGINGGFFAGSGGPLGLVYRKGRMVAPHVSRRPPRSGFGLTVDGKPLFGRLAATGPKIKDLDGGDWSNVELALGGGPRLVKDGSAKVTANLEELGPKGNDITRVAARSLVALMKNGKLVFCTVTGFRDNHRQGVKFGPLVGWLKQLGVAQAVNFDGGASVDMVVGSHIVSDGPGNKTKEKPVATALLVRDKRTRLYPDKVRWSLSKRTLPADGVSSCDIAAKILAANGKPVPDGTEVKLFAHGAIVKPALAKTKNGSISATLTSRLKPGRARIELSAGPISVAKSVAIKAGAVTKILIEGSGARPLEDEPSMQVAAIKVQTIDEWGNGVPKQSIDCSVDGSGAEFRTDNNGVMVLDVEVSKRGGTFSISHSKVGRVSYKIPAYKSTK